MILLVWGPLFVPCPWASEGHATPVEVVVFDNKSEPSGLMLLTAMTRKGSAFVNQNSRSSIASVSEALERKL